MSEPYILGCDFLVDTTSPNDTGLGQFRQQVGRLDRLGQIDGRHAVGLVLRLGGDLLEAEVGHGLLDAVRGLAVRGEALRKGLGQDLGEGSVEGVDKLGRGRGEVGGLLGLVVLHDGHPVLEGGEVGGGRRLASLVGLDGLAAEHGDGQAGRAADGLLARRHDTVQLPGVELDLLAGNAAHAVDDEQRLGRHALHQLGEVLELAQHARRGVDVGHGDHLVLLGLEGLLDLGQLRPATHGVGGQLGHFGAVCLEAVGEAVAEVAGAEDQHVLAGLDQVGGHNVPAQGAGARDDEGLRRGVGGLEELAQHRDGVAEGGDEAGSDMGLAARRKDQ